jgi:formate dehydrogenase major subunit
MEPANGYEDWEVTQELARAMGLGWNYTHPAEIMDEIARLTPSFGRFNYAAAGRRRLAAMAGQRCRARWQPDHARRRLRARAGKFVVTDYVPTDEKTGPRFPLLLTTGRILSQYNVGAQTRRTANSVWHAEDVLEIHPTDAENRGLKSRRLGAPCQPQGRDDAARAK